MPDTLWHPTVFGGAPSTKSSDCLRTEYRIAMDLRLSTPHRARWSSSCTCTESDRTNAPGRSVGAIHHCLKARSVARLHPLTASRLPSDRNDVVDHRGLPVCGSVEEGVGVVEEGRVASVEVETERIQEARTRLSSSPRIVPMFHRTICAAVLRGQPMRFIARSSAKARSRR